MFSCVGPANEAPLRHLNGTLIGSTDTLEVRLADKKVTVVPILRARRVIVCPAQSKGTFEENG